MGFFIVIGLLGFIVSTVSVINAYVRKKPARKSWIALLVSFYMMYVATAIGMPGTLRVKILDGIGISFLVLFVTCIVYLMQAVLRKTRIVLPLSGAALTFASAIAINAVNPHSAADVSSKAGAPPNYLYWQIGQHAYLEDLSRSSNQLGTLIDDVSDLKASPFSNLHELPHHDYPQGTEVVIEGWELIPLVGDPLVMLIKLRPLGSHAVIGYTLPVDLVPKVPKGTKLLLW